MNHSEQSVQVELRGEYIEYPEPGITDPIGTGLLQPACFPAWHCKVAGGLI